MYLLFLRTHSRKWPVDCWGVAGTLNVTVTILMLSIPALFDSIPQPAPQKLSQRFCCHVNCSIIQLFNDQWKINHQIWLHDNSLCCVRLDSMLCYNPLLAACEAQLRVPVNILTSVQFNPAAVAAAAQHFILPMLGQHVLVPSCYGGRQPPVIIVTRSRLATTLQPFNQTCCYSNVWRYWTIEE